MKIYLATSLAVLAAGLCGPVQAMDASEIVVQGQREPLPLNKVSDTGSRLGLTPRETPASLSAVTQETMQAKGLNDLVAVYDSVPGVVAGRLPGEPASASMRGFSTGAVSYLMDGVRVADSALVNRDLDSFNFERIEVLKGPASVLYGEGALAGAINLVSKKPVLGAFSGDALLSYGSFNSARAGLGLNVPLSAKAALRSDLSYGASDGYVDDTHRDTVQWTNSLRFEPTDRLSLLMSFDYFRERNGTPYQGKTLVSLSSARKPSDAVKAANGYVLDEALRETNYNVTDGRMDSDAGWLRLKAAYRLNDRWSLRNELSLYGADRKWDNSEDYSFNAATGLIDRTTTRIWHDHQFWSERLFLTGDTHLAGKRNRVSVGAEYNRTDFSTLRRFGTTTSVSLVGPVRGYFPAVDNVANFPGAGNRANFDSVVESYAVFAEDALNLNDKWLVIAGVRQDHIELDRRIADLNAGTLTRFGRSYDALSGRIGTVYEIAQDTQIYAQYSHAVTPVGSMVLSNILRASLDLTKGDSFEGGVKSSLLDERMTLTFAGYWLRQSGIITRDPANPALQVQGGVQSSRGVELSLSAQPTKALSIDANLNLQKARFDDLLGPGGISYRHNRPVNVPDETTNLNVFYDFASAPVTIGAGARHVGDIYTSTANTIRVNGYTTYEASLSYRLPFGTLTLRGRNLSDEFYAYWSGYGASQVYVAPPRNIELTLTRRF